MTCTHQAYEGKSNEKLLKAIAQLWDMINKNDMLPKDKSNPNQVPVRTGDRDAAIIGIIMLPLPAQASEKKIEQEKQAAHVKNLQMTAFRAAKNILKTLQAMSAFEDVMIDT